jgi:hypothetical protein
MLPPCEPKTVDHDEEEEEEKDRQAMEAKILIAGRARHEDRERKQSCE